MERETGRGIARNAQRYRYPTYLSLSVVADSAKKERTGLTQTNRPEECAHQAQTRLLENCCCWCCGRLKDLVIAV